VQQLTKNLYQEGNTLEMEILSVELYLDFIIRKPLSTCDGRDPKASKIPHLFIRILQKIQFQFYVYKNVIKTDPYDILLYLNHIPYKKHQAVEFFKKQTHGTVIYMIHDLIPLRYPQFCEKKGCEHFLKWLHMTFECADAYICVSKTTQKDLQQYMVEHHIDPGNYFIDTIQLGANIPTTDQLNLHIRQSIQDIFKTHKSVYLIVSTIEPRKNHQYLLDTFEKLWAQHMDVTLLIAGKKGWMVNDLIDRIEHHHEFGSRLLMLNDANDKEILYCYTHAKAFLFPSFIEGFGLPIIESLSNGLPVLASNTAIHQEVGGNEALYFDISDPKSLSSLIIKIEQEKYCLKIPTNSSHYTITWQESTLQLLEKLHIFLKSK
jgi:alpha-1,2-rhamnosyltransferase